MDDQEKERRIERRRQVVRLIKAMHANDNATVDSLVAALAGGGWWGWVKTHPADDGTAKLLTDTVKRGDLIESVSASGSGVPAGSGTLSEGMRQRFSPGTPSACRLVARMRRSGAAFKSARASDVEPVERDRVRVHERTGIIDRQAPQLLLDRRA